jgi:hypothetical protein
VSCWNNPNKWEKGSLVVEPSHIEHQDTLIVAIAEMKVASTSIREAQVALANALLDACCGYQDISAQIDYALTQSEVALEAARDKLEELKPQGNWVVGFREDIF